MPPPKVITTSKPAIAASQALAQNIYRATDLLHPIVRTALAGTLEVLHDEGIPFEIFESYRVPARQGYLYAQGREGRTGRIITNAKPWESYHQYGLAADIVLRPDGNWSWESQSGQYAHWWTRMHEVGAEFGLEPISWEQPHLQLGGLTVRDLQAGSFPGGGDAAWWDNLRKVATEWTLNPPSPIIK